MIENVIFGKDISSISKWAVSDRSFPDGGVILTESTIEARPSKNTADPDGIQRQQKHGVANDVMRTALTGVMVELAKIQKLSANILLKDLRSLKFTISAPSRDVSQDLQEILNYMTKINRFVKSITSSNIKMSKLYTFLFQVAEQLNLELFTNSFANKVNALNDLRSKISDPSFLQTLQSIANKIYNIRRFDIISDKFYEEVQDFFETNIQSLLHTTPDGSFRVMLQEQMNLLFKKLDSQNRPVKLKVKDLPSNIQLYQNDIWVKLRDVFTDENTKLDSAYMFVHSKDSNGILFNGLIKVENVQNYLPSGVYEGYYYINSKTQNPEIINNAFVSDAYGNYIYSRIELQQQGTDVNIKIRPEKWYTSFTDTNGLPLKELYVIFGFTSGSKYTCLLFDTEVKLNTRPSYQEYAPLARSPRGKRQRLVDQKNFLRNFVTAKEFYDAQIARPSLFTEVDFHAEIRDEMGIFPLDDNDLKIRNAHIENNRPVLGQGYSEIKDNLIRFLGDINGKIDYNDLDHRLYKILNFEFIKGTTSRVVKNIIYRRTEDGSGNKMHPLKAWLIEVRQMLVDYNPTFGDKLDNLIINLDLSARPAFSSHPTSFSNEDLELGQQLIDIMQHIFGSYTIKKMLAGTLFMDEKGIQFTIPPWRTLHQIFSELQLSLPHNNFRFGAEIKQNTHNIKNFVMDSIFSPWSINGFKLTSDSAFLFFSELDSSFDKKYEEALYAFTSSKAFTLYLEHSQNQDMLGKDKALGSLAKVLENILTQQIYSQYIQSRKSYYSTGEINELYRWRRLAVDSLYDTLFSTGGEAIEQRKKLYRFLTSEGREEVELDFSSGRLGLIFGNNRPLHHMTTFYKLKLTSVNWNFNFFQKYKARVYEMANSLSFSLVTEPYDTFIRLQGNSRFLPHRMLEVRSEYIIKIADFLKIIATKYVGVKPIRIFSFNTRANGYGVSTAVKMDYFPLSSNIDWNLPGNNYFYYEIDPNNVDSFSLEDFRIFLGALFADHQGFFVRIDGLNKGEFLFAFDLFGSLSEEDIAIPSSRYSLRPYSSATPLIFINPTAQSDLSNKWNSIISSLRNDNLLATIHRYNNINDWHNYLKILPMLNELKSSFDSI